MSFHFTKTSRVATITLVRPDSKSITVDREIYEDESGKEFVRMNCNWHSLNHYINDDSFEVIVNGVG